MGIPVAMFCSACGGVLTERFVEVERRWRLVCRRCGEIAYRNPRLLVSTLVAVGRDVLLCRRACAPAAGRWALPGGFVECGEALEEAAARETLEETGIRLDSTRLRLHALSSLTEISEVYVGFLAELEERPELMCGPECAEVRFVSEHSVPWDELAYPDIGNYLRLHFHERRTGRGAIHFSRLDAAAVVSRSYRIFAVDENTRPRTPLPDDLPAC